MASELERFRDHARRMSAAVHGDDCGTWTRGWRGIGAHRPDPDCPGCIPAGERALWGQLADEVAAYLAADPDVVHPTIQHTDDQPLEGL